MKPLEPLSREKLTKQARAFRAKKSLGQNFLIDPELLEKIVDEVSPKSGDTIVEIGPGLGFLTRLLAQDKVSLTAIELDSDFIVHLKALYLTNTQIVHADFLDFKLSQVNTTNKIKVVGNIPYQITAPILKHLLGEIGEPSDALPLIDSIVMTIQYEVAKRITASPGTKDYSQITLLVNYFSKPEILHIVPSNSFHPEPDVTSAVVRLIPLSKPAVECSNHKLLRQIISAGFSQRRKMLKNNLSSLVPENTLLTIFKQLHFDPLTRAERLSLAQFAILTDAIENVLNKDT